MSIIRNLKENSVILFWGDSITDGGRGRNMDGNHIMGSGYASMLSARLAVDYCDKQLKFINKGISGFGIGQLYERIQEDVIINKPDVLSVLVGINDILHAYKEHSGSPVDCYINTYRRLIHSLKNELPKTQIVVCEPFYLDIDNQDAPFHNTPYCMCEEYVNPFNVPKKEDEISFYHTEISSMQNKLSDFVKEERLMFVHLQDEFNRYASMFNGEYFIWDSVHPTVAGHELITRRWLSVVD